MYKVCNHRYMIYVLIYYISYIRYEMYMLHVTCLNHRFDLQCIFVCIYWYDVCTCFEYIRKNTYTTWVNLRYLIQKCEHMHTVQLSLYVYIYIYIIYVHLSNCFTPVSSSFVPKTSQAARCYWHWHLHPSNKASFLWRIAVTDLKKATHMYAVNV